uniref:Pyridoxamine 5'-phosphate oxidase n=1 Tax=Anisakis simplex TaxID=6269 RepID=A0A0M3JQL7_ANISI
LWPGKLRILRRAHGWVRDGYLTSDKWSDRDFMLHGWKVQKIGDSGWSSPFEVS